MTCRGTVSSSLIAEMHGAVNLAALFQGCFSLMGTLLERSRGLAPHLDMAKGCLSMRSHVLPSA